MIIKQISVFLENKQGRLAFIAEVLAKNSINIRALSLADTTNFGILRLIVNEPDRAEKILKDEGFTVSLTEVVSVALTDTPGGLVEILKILEEASMDVEYLYAFVGTKVNNAYVVLKVTDNNRTVECLKEHGYGLLDPDEVYKI